jgi:hypothetical protein
MVRVSGISSSEDANRTSSKTSSSGRKIIASDMSAGLDDFVTAIATHRHFARETDPPRV